MKTTNTAQPFRGGGHGGGGHGGGRIGGGFPGRGGRIGGGFPRRGGWWPPRGGYPAAGYGGYNSGCLGCCPGGRVWTNVRRFFTGAKAPGSQPAPPAPQGHAKPVIKRT